MGGRRRCGEQRRAVPVARSRTDAAPRRLAHGMISPLLPPALSTPRILPSHYPTTPFTGVGPHRRRGPAAPRPLFPRVRGGAAREASCPSALHTGVAARLPGGAGWSGLRGVARRMRVRAHTIYCVLTWIFFKVLSSRSARRRPGPPQSAEPFIFYFYLYYCSKG